MSHKASIEIVPGTLAPKYSEGTELKLDKVVITEQGTEARLPLVDIVMRGPDGELFLLVLNGRIVNAISAAIKGINMRNHGVAEP
jgi:hypothetical protein